MAGKIFPSGMDPRVGLKLADFLLIGNADTEEHEITTITELAALIGAGLRKEGYRWIKGEGNFDLDNWQVNDEFIGEGTLFPGHKVHGFVKNAAMSDMANHVTILSSVPV